MFVKELAKKLSKKRNEELIYNVLAQNKDQFPVSESSHFVCQTLEAQGHRGIRRTPKQSWRIFD